MRERLDGGKKVGARGAGGGLDGWGLLPAARERAESDSPESPEVPGESSPPSRRGGRGSATSGKMVSSASKGLVTLRDRCKQENRLGLDRACLVLSRGGTCTAKVPYSPCKECQAIRGNSSKSNKYIDLRVKPRSLSPIIK